MTLAGAHVAAMVACTTLAHLTVLLGGNMHPACWAFALSSLAWPTCRDAFGPLAARPATVGAVAAVALPLGAYLTGGGGHARAPAAACTALMGVLAARQASRTLPSHDLQALVLALLLTCAGALLNPTPSYALLLLPFAASGVMALMTRQLCYDLTLAALARGENAQAQVQLQRRDIVTARFAASVGALTCVIFAAAALTFVAFPRVGLPAFAGGGAHGLPSSVTLGGGAWTFADGEVVARVFRLAPGDYAQGLYLRGRTYDQLDPDGFAEGRRQAPRRPLATTGPELSYEVVQNVAEGDPVLTLGPVEVGTVITSDNNELPLTSSRAGDAPYFAAEAGSQRARIVGARMADGALLVGDGARSSVSAGAAAGAGTAADTRQSRGVDAAAEAGAAAASRHDAIFRAHYTALPPVLRQGLQPLLQDALAKASAAANNGDPVTAATLSPSDAVATAAVLRRHLLTRFVYDEAAPSVGAAGEGALLHFAAQARRGNCTYFAATYAALLRLAGIPSRVVGGYAGGRWDDAGRVAVFTGSHAHAWVEWYVPERGWVRDDATPGRTPEVLGTLAALRERLGRFWQLGVLQYNFGSQIDLWHRTRDGLRVLGALALPPAPREAKDPKLQRGAGTWAAVLGVLVAVATAWGPIARRVAARRRRRLSEVLQAALERSLGRPLRVSETFRTGAQALPASVRQTTRRALERAIDLHESMRFSRQPPSPEAAQILRGLLAEAVEVYAQDPT